MTQPVGPAAGVQNRERIVGRAQATSAGGGRAGSARRRPAPSAEQPDSCATIPSPPVTHELLLAGIDSLYASYYVDTRSRGFDWDALAYERETLRQAKANRFKELPFGTEQLALMPMGGHPYTYVLRNADFIIRLGENIVPACHVQFLAKGLWLSGIGRQHERILVWLRSVGLTPTRPEAVGRVDFAFDYNTPVVDFGKDNIVSRAELVAAYHKNTVPQTFQIGKGSTVVRLYDKVAEINEASDKHWFFELWGQTENVWRIEVQLRRDRLKLGAIRTIEDMAELGADALRETVSQHTTLRCVGQDTNRSRWPLHPLWRALQSDIDGLEQTGLIRSIEDKAGLEWRRRRLVLQAYGYLKRLGVYEYLQSDQSALPDLDRVIDALGDDVRALHSAGSWNHEIERLIAQEKLGL